MGVITAALPCTNDAHTDCCSKHVFLTRNNLLMPRWRRSVTVGKSAMSGLCTYEFLCLPKRSNEAASVYTLYSKAAWVERSRDLDSEFESLFILTQ
jgi:hypothetical protein